MGVKGRFRVSAIPMYFLSASAMGRIRVSAIPIRFLSASAMVYEGYRRV